MESVGGAQRSLPPRQKEVFGSAMHLPSQFDAVKQALIEAVEDHVLESPSSLPRERPLVKATGDRGDDLGSGKV